jgi:hypothetical protein
MDVVDIQNHSIKHFVDFAQRFCFNAPYLETGKSYQSDNGEFMIEYLPQITNHDGRVLTTPARISKVTGRIQVSKKQFDDYTVPMRFEFFATSLVISTLIKIWMMNQKPILMVF